MGTLATVLAQKKIRSFANLFQATVTGDIEDVQGVLKITRINVHYDLKVAENKKQAAEEAFGSYLHLCPAAQSVIGCIEVTHEMTTGNTPK